MRSKMKIIEKRLEDIRPYDNNPRLNDKAVDAVAASIKEFGFRVPILVDKNGVIIAGHTRLKAARANGLKKVPAIIVDDMTEDQENAFRLADNRVAELSEWDEEKLKEEMAALAVNDWSDFGVSDRELEKYEPEDGIVCPKCGYRFEE